MEFVQWMAIAGIAILAIFDFYADGLDIKCLRESIASLAKEIAALKEEQKTSTAASLGQLDDLMKLRKKDLDSLAARIDELEKQPRKQEPVRPPMARSWRAERANVERELANANGTAQEPLR